MRVASAHLPGCIPVEVWGALGTHGNHSGLHSRDSLGTLYSELSYTRRKHSGPDIWNG